MIYKNIKLNKYKKIKAIFSQKIMEFNSKSNSNSSQTGYETP